MSAHQEQLFRRLVVSLAGTISLLEHGGKDGAPSDRIFEQMLEDYREVLREARECIATEEPAVSESSNAPTR